jgi:hypothetical protein
MVKEIISKKIIIDLNNDGTFKKGLLQYQIKNDGVVNNKYYTISIDSNFVIQEKSDGLKGIINDSISIAETAEGIVQHGMGCFETSNE